MALTKLSENLAIHQGLDDEPNDVGGLSAAELKAKYDKAALCIQTYLNGTHLPEVESALAALLTAAKEYADEKVVKVGSSDMAMAVYDPGQKKCDVFDFASRAAKKEAGDATSALAKTLARAVWCGTDVLCSCTGIISGDTTANANLNVLNDPLSIVKSSADGSKITVPDGANKLFFTFQMFWGHQTFANCTVSIIKNGVVLKSWDGPYTADPLYYTMESGVVQVAPKDVLQVRLQTITSTNPTAGASMELLAMRMEILG